MSTHDISRFLFQPAKHYIGSRWQSGRGLLESDFNEGAQLDDEEQRRVLSEVIGPAGSPDQGFAAALEVGDEVPIRAVSFNGAPTVDVLDFGLRPGAMYVGGQRFEHEADGDPVVFQSDFLQMGPDAAPQPQPGQSHGILTVLHCWEQCVSAVEDEEIRERALGGVDTSVRVRRMTRVVARDVDAEDCGAAWDEVRQQLEAEGGGTFDATETELLSSARLRVTFDDGAAEDPCAPCGPHDAGRYLGAQNQAIRIMLVQPPTETESGRYAWAFDNASPMYRARVGEDDAGIGGVVTMLTPPRDEERWPLTDTVVELVPWGGLLGNGQKVAAPIGAFFRVTQGYDPDTASFRIDAAALAPLDDMTRHWDAAHPDIAQLPNTADPDGDFLFMRVWHRLDPDDVDVLIDTAPGPGSHQLLRRLGLVPEFSGTGQAGDSWVIAVRPNTPQQIVPWNLTQAGGVPPHGPRRFFAPLTLLGLRPPGAGEHAGTEVVESIHDCRRRFSPLVDRTGCCTHTVGDGATSHGDFASIQDAIEALPAGGGRVCVLPGHYAEEVVISRSDVVVEGCAGQSTVETPAGDPSAALIHVLAPRVALRDLVLHPQAQIGVLVGPQAVESDVRTEDVTIEGLEIAAAQRAGLGGQTRSTIDVRNGRRVTVRRCACTMDGSLSDEAAMFVRGEDIHVEHNRIETFGTGTGFGAWGGLQIGGGSSRIAARRNRIVGGIGHGITLGSLRWIPETDIGVLGVFGAGTGLQNLQDPCDPRHPTVNPVIVSSVRWDPVTAGDLDEITIVDNHIEAMSGNGISVLTTLPIDEEGDDDSRDRITVSHLAIERNRIVGNVTQPAALSSAAIKTKKLQGPESHELFGQFAMSSIPPAGIALVDGEHIVIRDNEIRQNGTGDSSPVCGICIVYGDHIVIEGNRIVDNGVRDPGSIASAPTTRAGVVVSLAGVAPDLPDPAPGDLLGSSLRVVGNVVDHPNGPALSVRVMGPLVIDGNFLQSRGNNASAQAPGRAHCVVVAQMGRPWEAVDLAAGEPSPDRWIFPPRTPEYLHADGGGAPGNIAGQGGRVMFTNNHVTLRWTQSTSAGGLASGFSVGICAHDDVTMTGNQLAVDVEDPGAKKKAPDGLDQRPHMLAHAVVVGATANAAHNRVSEGVNDALISLLVLGGLLVSSTHNVTTHQSFASTCNSFTPGSANPPFDRPGERVDRGNLVLLRPQAQSSAANLVSQSTLNRTANELFETFCANCLGLGTGRDFVAALAVIAAALDRVER